MAWDDMRKPPNNLVSSDLARIELFQGIKAGPETSSGIGMFESILPGIVHYAWQGCKSPRISTPIGPAWTLDCVGTSISSPDYSAQC